MDHCDHSPGRFLIHRVTLQELLGWLLSVLPPRTEIVPATLKCCAKRRTRNWYIYFRYWTSAGSEGHFMPDLCSPSSRKKDPNLELSAHRPTLSLGQLLYCVSCDLHQQPLADCESMTKISGLFTLKYSSSLTFLVLFLVLNKNL